MKNQDKNTAFVAAEGREYLQDALAETTNEHVREIAGYMTDPQKLDLLNYYCGLYEDVGENFLQTPLARLILRGEGTRTMSDAMRAGNLSQMKAIMGMTGENDDYQEAFNEVVSRLTQEGTICVVCGPPGAGKTTSAIDFVTAAAARTGAALYGNTEWDRFDAQPETDVELLEMMASHSRPAIGVIDEAMQVLDGRGEGSTAANVFSDRAALVRKKEGKHGPHPKKGILVLIFQTWGKVAKPIRELCTVVVEKPSRKDPGKVTLYDSPGGKDERDEIDTWKGLTDSREDFPGYDPGTFSIVTDDEQDDEDDGPDPDEIRRQEQIRAALSLCKPWDEDEGLSYSQAAQEPQIDYADSWIGDRCREWKDGEHREIVAAPTEGTA